MNEVDIRKLMSTVGPNLNKFCLTKIHNICYDVILEFIESRKSTLKELNFFYCKITDDFLQSISLIKGLNLTSFSLRGCKESTNVGFRKLCKSQKNIKEIDISYWEGLSDESLMIISEFLPNIRILRVEKRAENITSVSLHLSFCTFFLNLLSLNFVKLNCFTSTTIYIFTISITVFFSSSFF